MDSHLVAKAMTAPLSLSVFELIPRPHQPETSADAVAASIALAQRANELGFRRHWVAEHHNVAAVASTNPAVLIGILAANTKTKRILES